MQTQWVYGKLVATDFSMDIKKAPKGLFKFQAID